MKRRMRKRENNAIQEGRVIFGRGSEQTSVALRAVRGKREREREEENTAAKTHWRICGITIFAHCRTVVVGANAESTERGRVSEGIFLAHVYRNFLIDHS